MVTSFDKAIVGLLVPIITFAAAHFGMNIDAQTSVYLSGFVTGIVVYLVPNKLANTPTS